MSWGRKLMIVFGCFALLMSTLVYKCMTQKFDLVSKDYYNEELRYQDKIDGINNASKIGDVVVNDSIDKIFIQLPKEVHGLATSGQVWFYCVTDDRRDKKIDLEVDDEGSMVIDKASIIKSDYLVKVKWQNGDTKYYTEQKFSIH